MQTKPIAARRYVAAVSLLMTLLASAAAFGEDTTPAAPRSIGPEAAPEPGVPAPEIPLPGAGAPETPPPRAEKTKPLPKAAPKTLEERAALLNDLYGRLKSATSAEAAAILAEAIERTWQVSGSATVDLLMSRSSEAFAAKDTELSLQLLGSATSLAPNFAEAWNQRAAINFSAERYEQALVDLRRVLALEPRHYKALTGLAVTFQQLGQKDLALKTYRKVLEVYPLYPDVKEAVEQLSREVEGEPI